MQQLTLTLERCFVLEEKLRDLTGDENITWEKTGDDSNDLEVVEHSGGGHPNRQLQHNGSIRNLMTKFFRSPTTHQKPIVSDNNINQSVST